jgi:DNA-binding NtrC family response regulator
MDGETVSGGMGTSPSLRVLIIDDEPLIRWSMGETLAQAGWTTSGAGSAREALQLLALDPKPDVILLDYRLPDSNDLGLLKRVRDAAPASVVIMMTAYGTPDMHAGAMELGAYRVIGKPVEMTDLPGLTRQAYESRRH